MIEKECEICGVLFDAHSKSQKYCPTCKENPRTLKRQMQRALRDSYRRNEYAEITIYDKICAQCGTTFKTSNPNRKCCNSTCEIQYNTERLTCLHCKANLYAKGIIGEIHTKYNFCDDDCKSAYKYEQAKQKGYIHYCKQCNKEFISKDGKFCSRDCYAKYASTHKRPRPAYRQQPKPIYTTPKTTYTCPICKNVFESVYRHKNDCCSKECNKIFTKKAEEITRLKQLKKYICDNGMCSICTVSYTQCERMQSNFRIIPEGARYIDSKIQICPKFKTNFK